MASVAALIVANVPSMHAETWVPGAGGSWATPGNWNPATVPNAIGTTAIFNTPTAARTVTIDSGAVGFTVGSISFDNNSANNNSLTTGTVGSKLILDNGGAGATITATGTGTGNNTISVPLIFSDLVRGIVNQTASSSAAGSLNLTAAISGTGGFTKQGDGLATFGTGAKTYTGATVLSGGRIRISNAAQPSATSSFTINGGQLELITAGTYTFGSGPLNLNGFGATSGPFATFPGAIRNTRGVIVTITNPVVLQSDTLIHVQANAGTGNTPSPVGSTTFSNSISGPGSLSLTAPASDIDQGFLVLTGNNSYLGGTFVNGGILAVSGASANLGLGNVTVDDAASFLSIARLMIQSGVSNAIADTATLILAGGGAAGVADENFVDLQSGINEVVAGLVLGGVAQGPGTYGSSSSTATFQNDEYFTGVGVVTVATVVPEPGISTMLFASLGLLLGQRRRKNRCS